MGLNQAASLARDFDAVAFDHGVGEQLFAHLFDLRFGGGAVGAFKLDLDALDDARILHAAKAQILQRAGNGLALHVQNAGLQADSYDRFHECSD
mgnify:CR=1 FL=1